MEISVIEKTLRPEVYKKQTTLTKKFTGIAPSAYWALTAHIDDDHLSEWEIFKFKSLFSQMHIQAYAFSTLAALASYNIIPRLFKLRDYGNSHFRNTKVLLAFITGIIVYRELNIHTFPNKHFHELITQPEPRGRYIRMVLKDSQPRKWALLSKDLHSMGYNFREMNEYSHREEMPHPSNKFDNNRL